MPSLSLAKATGSLHPPTTLRTLHDVVNSPSHCLATGQSRTALADVNYVPLNGGVAVRERFWQTQRYCLIAWTVTGNGNERHWEESRVAECDYNTAASLAVTNKSAKDISTRPSHEYGGATD